MKQVTTYTSDDGEFSSENQAEVAAYENRKLESRLMQATALLSEAQSLIDVAKFPRAEWAPNGQEIDYDNWAKRWARTAEKFLS